jgi:hypothetical protein
VKAGALAVLLTALALSGCIQSDGPILSDSDQIFGAKLRLQLYGLNKGFARDPESVSFAWNGHHYARSGAGLRDVSGFTIHSFEGDDFIIQTVPSKAHEPTEFAIAHRLADGVWQVVPIDEADADGPTRDAFCNGNGSKESTKSACVIETRQQLLAFARATAAQRKDDGGLAIRLPDKPDRKTSRRR